MSKGGGGTRTIQSVSQSMTDPTTAPFKEFALSEAKRLYDLGPQQYFPGSTVVGFSPETEAALAATRQKAIDGSPLVGTVQDLAMAPAAYEFGFADINKLGAVGAAREAQDQAELSAEIDRFQFEQQAPQIALANYLASVQGGQLGTQQITPYYSNPFGSALSGALGGYYMGGQAGLNPMFAALLGGGAGLLGV